MRFYRTKNTLLAMLLWLFSFSIWADSYSVDHFRAIADDVNRAPYPVYQQLLAIEKNKSQLSDEAYLWFLYRKAHAETLLYFHDDFAKTVELGLSLIDQYSSAEVVASLKSYAGLVAERKGKYKKAIALFKEAMSIAERENLNSIYTQTKHYHAYTLSLTELYESSLSDLQEAYVEAYALEDQFLIALINETYGAVYGYMNEYDKSIEHYNRALDTYSRLGYKPYVAEAVYGLASTYRYMGEYDLAIDKFNLYRENIAYTPNQDISYFGAYGLGMTYAEKGDCPQALAAISTALSMNGQIDYDAELLKKQAQCFIEQGELTLAEQSIDQASEIFADMPQLEGTRWTLELIKLRGHLAFANKEYEQAYLLVQDFYQRYTKVQEKNSNSQLIRVKAAMELERQNVEVSLLQQRNKVQQLQIAEQALENRQQTYLIVVTLMVLVLIAMLAINQYRAKQRILSLSITDPLSGSYNRRYIFNHLDRSIESRSAKQGELTILLFDIDNFKEINDTYGHPFGDEVICRIVQITQETLRLGDSVGRIGGEEFLCILPRADAEQGKAIATRLKDNIQHALFTTEQGEQVTITVSVGVSELSNDVTDRGTLYVNADKALYEAKNSGKNHVVIFQAKG